MELRRTKFVLAAIAGVALGALLLDASAASAAPPEVQKLVLSHCQQCHEIKGIPDFGNVGPSLVDLKSRFPDRKEVAAIIFDETKRNPQTVMPPFGRNLILTGKEMQEIVDYLYTQ
jgi:L-cysteine S-thiosulfotransferase